MHRFARVILAPAILLFSAAVASAQGDQQPAAKPSSTYDRIWTPLTDWYNDKENPVVQRILFTGRFQLDYADVDADHGKHSEWNVRRLRLGPRITIFRDYLVHAEVELNPQEQDPFYVRMTDAYLAWQKHPKAVVTVGKQSVPFTQEGATSSKELVTIDRSNLVNNIWFTQEYMPGVSLSGRAAPWTYRAGIYSSGAMNREFGKFNGDAFTLALVGYDFAKTLKVREATLTGNYLYQHPDVNNTFTKRFEHIMSIHFKLEQPHWGFRSDLSETKGYLGQRNVLGVMAMPLFNATDKLQFVVRYTYLDSDGINGLSLANYENKVVTGRGDRYTESYIGANYYFYGHRLKLQTGVQFADMQDRANDGGAYSGTSWTTGLRMGW
jgi:phosphate-selective porin OprO and OprP